MIWRIGFDPQEAKKAGKEAGKAQQKEQAKGGGAGSSAFMGGALGGLFGNLLSSVEQLFQPLSAVATLLVSALFPILKPFLILFLKVGLLMYKWLNSMIGGLSGGGDATTTEINAKGEEVTKAGTGLAGSLFLIGAIVAGVAAALMGAPVLIIGAVALLGGMLVSKVGTFFADVLLGVATKIDSLFGSNLLEPLKTFFTGITMIGQGIYDMFASLLSLDFVGVWDGLTKVWQGSFKVLEGIIGVIWESLKLTFTLGFDVVKGIGTWIIDSLKSLFTTSFEAIRGIGTWIRDKIKSIFSSLNPFSRGGGGGFVNDAIITPSGDVIRTNPSDYLIATKTPGSFGGGGSPNVTVNVQGVIDDSLIREISQRIMRDLNLGGRF